MGSNILPTWHPYRVNTPKKGQRANTIPTVTTPLIMAAMGDSITQFARTSTGTSDVFENIGYLTNYLGVSRQRMRTFMANNLGLAGNTTAQMVARKTDLNAINFDVCFLMGGINDIKSTQSVSSIISNLTDLLNYITLTLGKRCVFLTILPNASWSPLTAPQIVTAKSNILQINAWIMAQHGTRLGRVVSVDCYTNFSNGTDDPKPNTTYDNIHPSAYGAMLIANDIQTRIAPWYGVGTPDFTTGNLLSNGTMTGTSGTLGANFAGSVANNFTVSAAGSSTQRTASKISNTQRLAMSITGGTATDTMRLSQSITSGFAVGDTVYGMALVQIQGTPSNIFRNALELRLTGTGVPTKAIAIGNDWDEGTSQIAATYIADGQYLIVTPDLNIASGSSMTLEWRYEMQGVGTTSCAGTVDVIGAGVFKR